jgi:hypothetical protein
VQLRDSSWNMSRVGIENWPEYKFRLACYLAVESQSNFAPQHGWLSVRNVEGSEPLPTILNDPKSLHHSPSGTSGSLSIHVCSFRMSAAQISLVLTLSSSFLLFHAGRFLQFMRGIVYYLAILKRREKSSFFIEASFGRRWSQFRGCRSSHP